MICLRFMENRGVCLLNGGMSLGPSIQGVCFGRTPILRQCTRFLEESFPPHHCVELIIQRSSGKCRKQPSGNNYLTQQLKNTPTTFSTLRPVCLASRCSHSKYPESQMCSFQPQCHPAALCVPKRLLKALGYLGKECMYLYHYF